jgi:hypothetical protein
MDRPASSCIIGRIGVKAKRPMPIATASAASPEKATVGTGTERSLGLTALFQKVNNLE